MPAPPAATERARHLAGGRAVGAFVSGLPLLRAILDRMAATVMTTCERCGDVELPIAAASLSIPGHDAVTAVEFRCPQCDTPQRRVVTERATLLLLRAGAGVTADAGPLGSERLPSPSDESR